MRPRVTEPSRRPGWIVGGARRSRPGWKRDMKRHSIATLCCMVAFLSLIQAADRSTITFADARIFPESLTSTKDGALYFGSFGQKSVYRAGPNASQATVWIKPETAGLNTVLGVFADEGAGVLWVCSSTS